MVVYFISDVHLREDAEDITNAFIDFCAALEARDTRLYILGDLFDAWLGDDMMLADWQNIVQALRRMHEQGCQLFFQRGNRDFLVGEEFLSQSGCQLLADETILSLHGKRIFVDHGEIFCAHDQGAHEARQKSRDPNFHRQCLALSHKQRLMTKEKFFATSAEHKSQQDQKDLQASRPALLRCLEEHDCDVLIYGHTHQPECARLDLKGRARVIINPGYWGLEDGIQYAQLTEAGIQLRALALSDIAAFPRQLRA